MFLIVSSPGARSAKAYEILSVAPHNSRSWFLGEMVIQGVNSVLDRHK
jgi:hypothetical protein